MTPADTARQHATPAPASGGVRRDVEAVVPWYDRRPVLGAHCTHGRHWAQHAHVVYREPVSARRAMWEAFVRITIRDDHARRA